MKSFQGLVNFVIGCSTSPITTLVYIKEKVVIVIMKFEVHILRLILSINMAQQVLRWKRQKRCYNRKKS